MNEHDHTAYEDDLAAYLLDALTDDETREMERHIAGCPRCQERARWLQRSVEMLPTAVEQLEPPPELRERLMQTVRAEAEAEAAAPPAVEPARRDRTPRTSSGRGWLGRLFALPRPAIGLAVMFLLAGGILGYALGNSSGGSDVTTVQAQVVPAASGARVTLEHEGDRGILRVSGLPQHSNRIYEVWLARGKQVRPAGLFQVDRRGRGAAGIPSGLKNADQVMVTLERPGGSDQPTSDPLVIAEI